jgi:5-methylthioadenosine/S-adenosylhomocysteine deaminase
MSESKTIIRNVRVISMDETVGDFDSADVLISDGRIVAIAPSLGEVDAEEIDGTGKAMLPGFVDTHRHTWQAPVRGLAADWTLGQYMTGLHLGLSALFTPEDTYAGNLLGAVEALNSGITTMLDWSHNVNTPEHADGAISGLFDSGIRAVFAHGGGANMYQVPSNVPHDQDVRRIQNEYFSSNDQLVTLAMALRGPQFSNIDITESDIALARELGLRCSIHAGDGEWGRSRPITRMRERGLLGSDITYVHCNTLADDELLDIADSGGTVSLAPDIELGMGHGWPATGRVTAVGIRPSLSIDTCTSNAGHMFGVMRTALATQRGLNNQVPGASDLPAVSLTSREVLEFGTINGARALALDDRIGTLTPGKQADLILVDVSTVEMSPLNNPIGQIVYGGHPGLVDTVMIAGVVVKSGGRLVGDVGTRAVRLGVEARDRIFAAARHLPSLPGAAPGGHWQPAPLGAAAEQHA